MFFVLRWLWVYLEKTARLQGLTLIWMWYHWLILKNIYEYSLLSLILWWLRNYCDDIVFLGDDSEMNARWKQDDSDMTGKWLTDYCEMSG